MQQFCGEVLLFTSAKKDMFVFLIVVVDIHYTHRMRSCDQSVYVYEQVDSVCTDLAVQVKYTDRRLTVFFISNRPIFSYTSLKWQRLQQSECHTSIPLNSALRNSHTLSMAMLCPMPPRRLTVRLWIASSAKDEAHQPEIPEQTVNVFFQSVTDLNLVMSSFRIIKHLVVSVKVHLHGLTIGSTVNPTAGSTVEPTVG